MDHRTAGYIATATKAETAQPTECMFDGACGDVPSRLLESMAARITDQFSPIQIRDNEDRAALAAEALWLFAQRTGLAQDGESLETVLIDFLADVFHLCEQTALMQSEDLMLSGIFSTAEMHFRMDQ